MLGYAVALIFVIAFVINATSTATDAVFSPLSLLLVGLVPRAASRRNRHRLVVA